MFTSCSSLWTDFHCVDADKTRVYVERSKSSPINLWLDGAEALPSHNPLLQIIPHVLPRLKSVVILGTPENLQDVTARLSHPAPLLEDMMIDGRPRNSFSRDYPTLAPTLFNEDLSSLRKLFVQGVHTTLPWRNMVNLTSFTLSGSPEKDEITIRQLLDFLENAPGLLKVKLKNATPTSGAQNGRLVSLPCLTKLVINGGEPSSLLLDHLLIPVGAKVALEFEVKSPDAPLEDYLPRALGNLGNLSNFTNIGIYLGSSLTHMKFSGPNGQVSALPCWGFHDPPFNATCKALQSLALFDAATVLQLEIIGGRLPSGSHLPHQAFAPMKGLRTLKLARCPDLLSFIHALYPNRSQPNILVFPGLEELVLSLGVTKQFDIESIAEMAAARALRGAKLKLVHFVCSTKPPASLLGVAKHVSRVRIGSVWHGMEDDSAVDSSNDGFA